MIEDNPPYITLLPTVDPHKWIVTVMVWSVAQDGYTSTRASVRLSRQAAEALAESWHAASKYEVRL